MAPISHSAYFPSLEKCLDGEELLISWSSVFTAIQSDVELGSDHKAVIQNFLADTEVLGLLTNPFAAFPGASAQTKAIFETKTSAINVTPSSVARHDIKEIKEDAIWLSNAAKIDEVTALRIVVEECQSRASAQLLGPFSEEELSSIREAAGNGKYTSPIPVALLSQGADAETIKREFDSKDSRRQRILLSYLSERQNFLKCVERLLHGFFLSASIAQEDKDKGKGPKATTWVADSGKAIVDKLDANQKDTFVLQGINYIVTSIKNIETGSDWFSEDGGREVVELGWIRNQIAEATHAMEIIWSFLVYVIGCPSSRVVLEWFKLQQACQWFTSFSMDESSIQVLVIPMQAISTILSVAMLDLTDCLDILSNLSFQDQISANVALDRPYLMNSESILNIHKILLEAADMAFVTAGPAIFAWSVLLQTMLERVKDYQELSRFERQSSHDTEQTLATDIFSETVDKIKGNHDEDPIDFLARGAVNSCRIFETITAIAQQLGNTSDAFFSTSTGSQMRLSLLDVIRSSTRIGYIPEIVEATIAALTAGQSYWDISDSIMFQKLDDPVAAFLEDDILVGQILVNAQSRYPYEPLPFLKIVRGLAASSYSYGGDDSKSAAKILENLSIFTYTLPPDFSDYQTTQEEDNNNNIRLTRDIQLFEPRSRAVRYQASQSMSLASMAYDDDFCIPAGTLGRIISESGPRVAFWYHKFSGLKYIGKLLETFLTAADQVDVTTGLPADRDSVSEIIGILATLLLGITQSAKSNPNSREDAEHVLKEASSGLSRNRDITTVIFDIFEEELQNQSSYSGSDVPLEILVNSVQFIHAMIPIFPGRVWSLLSRSGLLGVGQGGGQLATIVESVELLSGRYELLFSCCRLFESLVDDFASNAIHRRRRNKSSTRFQGAEDKATGIPDQVLSKILLSFTRYLVDVLESSCDWKYVSRDDQRRLSRTIAITFDKVLRYAHAIEPPVPADEETPARKSMLRPVKDDKKKEKTVKLMEPLMASASHLFSSFLSGSSSRLRFQPLLRAYFNGFETPATTAFPNRLRLWTAQVNSILSFSKTLLQVSTLLERAPSDFESQLFKASSLVARLYAANDSYHNGIVTLFEYLLVSASSNTSEPPSLLGHLGPQTAKNFLHVLSDLDKPLSRDENVSTLWHFLSIVVSSRQQWFANYLLTGKTPRDALETKPSGKELVALDRTLLTTALEKLSNISKIPSYEALAILEFIALAQNFWPWTVCDSPKYTDFIKSIADFVGKLKPLQKAENLQESIKSCYQTRIAAYIAEIFAMHLFHSRQTGAVSPLKDIVSNLDYFERWAIAPPKNKGYNASLHSLLKINFEARYPGTTIRDLKRTTLDNRQFGKEYFYDLSLAEKMLGHEEAWTGRKNDGLRAEFENANVNLSLVDAQTALFHSWRFLSIELSASSSNDQELQKKFAHVVLSCLIENQENQPPEDIFSKLSQTRVDFALVLSQRLIQANSSVVDGRRLLSEVWKTICCLRDNFERAVPSSDILYYRSLLKMLFLAVRFNAESKAAHQGENLRASMRIIQSSNIIPTIIDILKYVVSMGLREVVAAIHEAPADSSPEDLALLTGIMQSCLRIPGIELYHSQIVSIMISNSTAHIAAALFSWSDKVAIGGDPIYGELSILFLLELSSMPPMAEQLAINGILGHIASADITSYLRRPGVSPFADSTGLQRCYSIWARGILPLLLNLLDAVQASIATEVALFLLQFPVLLTQCEQALDAPETNRIIPKGQTKYITLTICSEVHSMALLSFILNDFRERLKGTLEIPEVKWDGGGVLENAEFWLSSKALLRERLLPMGERETEMVRQKLATGQAVSQLEKKVMTELNGIRNVLSAEST